MLSSQVVDNNTQRYP